MITAYVKHYLTENGLHYFQQEWMPSFMSAIEQQPGFISLSYTLNSEEKDLIDVVLKFQDAVTLSAWAETPLHDQFVLALDAHRSRDYWEAALTEEEGAALEWEVIRPVNE